MRRLLLVLAVVGLLAVRASARAGGGESYSGSSRGSSSYSYGSGSTDSGDLLSVFLYMYVQFVFRYPLVGFPLTLFILYMTRSLWLELRPGNVRSLSGGDTPDGGQVAARRASELARLRARDPAFDEREFLRRAGAAFLKIQEAWSAGDMSSARAFISDGVRERFERQLAGLKARGLRNLMEAVEVRDKELLACRSDKHFDELWVRVAAAASDRMVDASGATVSGSPGRQEFEEVWSFLRRPGAKTLKGSGVIEGSCPSCGSSLPLADASQCPACKTWVNSGEYDWVLSEITQSCEWVMREPSRDVDGWAEAAAGDPALNLPTLEDRASVIFWRWLDARRSADPAPLRPVADEAFCGGFAAGEPAAFDDAAVGAVEVVAFEDAGAWTRVHIGVKWSAGGEVRRDFFVLSRARGAKTDARRGLSTARCPSCGAPPAERSEAACGYCGAALNDGKKDWVLTEIVPFGEWKRAPSSTASGGATSSPYGSVAGLDWGGNLSPADAYGILARATLADGEETMAERAFLEAYAESRGLPRPKAAEIAAAARAGLLDAPRPEDGAQAEAMLRGMIRMSLADGVVTEDERAALHAFAARFALRPDDITTMIVEEREAMSRGVRGVDSAP
ncbi:MAG: TIM44-like domain-containing protein [Elusimicrobia bacterium]|nr:TIM44-like domain-containing protein [Elusimicrobiota bacterium]